MFRLIIALGSGIVLAAGLVGIAEAAPKEDQKNVESIMISCGGGIGDLEVLVIDNAVVGFGGGGETFVAKIFHFEAELSITTFDGQIFGPFPDSFTEGANGDGFEDRLIECTFSDEFADIVLVDEGFAEFTGIPSEYVGTEATVEVSEIATIWVIDPGK